MVRKIGRPEAIGGKGQRVVTGDVVADRELTTISGNTIRIPDIDQLVHLQLRRFAGCPICSLHLRSVVQRHDELAAARIREVVVFHSPPEEFLGHEAEYPFSVIPDPEQRLYVEFGVEPSPRAVLDPRSWWPTLRGLLSSIRAIIRKQENAPHAHPHGGRLGLPADLLIAGDGRVIDCKYGKHAYDQWSVDELLARASQYDKRSETTREAA